MATQIEFTRGDAITHQFYMPTSAWSSGGKLFFEAKPAVDDDTTDAAAVISESWDDSVVSDATVTINNQSVACKKYACYFPPSATSGIVSDGAESGAYKGEFQWVSSAGIPITFPAKSPKLDVIVYFDIIRKTA